jgi:xylose isomerase
MKPFIGNKEYFPGIGKIPYEGPKSKNPLAFKFYDPQKKISSKTMEEHLRFSIAYWHSFCGSGVDMFGAPTHLYAWNEAPTPLQAAEQRLDAAFEFITKIGAPFYCFHDRDLAPEGRTPAESEKNLMALVEKAKERQKATGVKLLWGTANLFSHPRYMNGAATNPDFRVVAHAAAQVKAAIDATITLEGQGYVFWGGREGYTTLLNTDLKREQEHLARFLIACRDYARKQGFKGAFYIEPKPMEPTKHQYDFDVATVIGFLRKYGLEKDFKINIEANHAELAGHDFVHELTVAAAEGMLGSIDANRGDPRNGWDTDQFPTNLYETTLAMLVVLKMGGFATGGLNFDAKLRRDSTDPEDLFIAHIGGMDAFALGLEVAHRILEEGVLPRMVQERYASFDSGAGKKFETQGMSLEELAALATEYPDEGRASGKQELFENILNDYLLGK